MKKATKRSLFSSTALLTAFGLWTAAVCTIDVAAIGPEASSVGFASINRSFHHLTGVHMSLYDLTDWLSLIPIVFALGFALLGLCQWIRRRSLSKVDRSILILGGFYLVVIAAFALFEAAVINFRPVLIDGILEASYPSSTTLLVLCVMPTAMMQLHGRIRRPILRRCSLTVMSAFTAFMVICRLISGVHWLSDIIGGVLLSTGLVMAYHGLCTLEAEPS